MTPLRDLAGLATAAGIDIGLYATNLGARFLIRVGD